ncbi:MAG: DnaA/Hda family protein [Candidatus Nitrospinota bacterium M3_3B_026]
MQLKFPFPAHRKDSFENFASDGRNAKTLRLCRAFAEGAPGQPKSLALHGPRGAGKTHLLSAMGRRVKELAGGGAALYLDVGVLAEKTMEAGAYERIKRFTAKYENAAFLAMDNLDLAAGDKAAEEQVFHLYNAVAEGGGRIAAAVEAAPSRWIFNDHLKTRLLWGQVLRLEPVGDEGMSAALVKMASDAGFVLPEAAARWLVTRLPRDPESLMEALERVDRYSLTTGRKVSINLIKEALE